MESGLDFSFLLEILLYFILYKILYYMNKKNYKHYGGTN